MGHIDNLKKEIIRTIRSQSMNSSHTSMRGGGSQTKKGTSSHNTLYPNSSLDSRLPPSHMSPPLSHERTNSEGGLGSTSSCLMLDPADLEDLKQEIVRSLKLELREISHELATVTEQVRQAASSTLTFSSELYQTHLYTQL